MATIQGSQKIELKVDHNDLASALQSFLAEKYKTSRSLYVKDSKIYACDGYGPWDDSLVTEDPQAICILEAIKALRTYSKK